MLGIAIDYAILEKADIINLPQGKAAVIKGLKDYIVVDDGKVLLIYLKAEEQQIKHVANEMAESFESHYL